MFESDLYDRLLADPCIAGDGFALSNLHVFRPRQLLMLRAIERYLESGRGTIADVGCHNGFFLRLAHEALGFSRCIGIDFFELPPERSFLTGLGGAEFIRSNFNERGFLSKLSDSGVDVVASTEVFEHLFNHPVGYLEECLRVLKPRGLLLLTTPNPATLANAARLVLGRPTTWGDKAFAQNPKVSAEGSRPEAFWDIHFREYPHSELRQILLELGSVEILEEGFIANAGDPREPLPKRLTKTLAWATGLGHARPLAATQYFVLRKK